MAGAVFEAFASARLKSAAETAATLGRAGLGVAGRAGADDVVVVLAGFGADDLEGVLAILPVSSTYAPSPDTGNQYLCV